MDRKTRLIVALDVDTGAEALDLARTVGPQCDALKVNLPLTLSEGLGLVDRLADHGYVLCDFKLADPPFTNRRTVEVLFRHRAGGVIVHAFPGEDALRACVETASGDVFAVTAMSHPGAEAFMVPRAQALAATARKAGAAGIVAGATRPDLLPRLREAVGDRLILTPGIGPQGGEVAETLRQGADHLIVGRRIVGSADPAAAARDLRSEIKAAEKSL